MSGLTGALTGPGAGTSGPAVEGLRLYVDRINAAGGIKAGRSISSCLTMGGAVESRHQCQTADNSGERRPDDQFREFIVNLRPTVAELSARGDPFAIWVPFAPGRLSAGPDPLQFCTTPSQADDSRATLAFCQGTKGSRCASASAMAASPRSESTTRRNIRRRRNGAGDKEIIPPPTPDYTHRSRPN